MSTMVEAIFLCIITSIHYEKCWFTFYSNDLETRDWLIVCLCPIENFSFILRHRQVEVKYHKFRPLNYGCSVNYWLSFIGWNYDSKANQYVCERYHPSVVTCHTDCIFIISSHFKFKWHFTFSFVLGISYWRSRFTTWQPSLIIKTWTTSMPFLPFTWIFPEWLGEMSTQIKIFNPSLSMPDDILLEANIQFRVKQEIPLDTFFD